MEAQFCTRAFRSLGWKGCPSLELNYRQLTNCGTLLPSSPYKLHLVCTTLLEMVGAKVTVKDRDFQGGSRREGS